MADVICGPCSKDRHQECKRELQGDDYSMRASCACRYCKNLRGAPKHPQGEGPYRVAQ